MATLATDRRLHHRHADAGFDRPLPPAVRVHRVLAPVAADARQQEGRRADRATGRRGADRAFEALRAERDWLAGETKTHRGRAGEHHVHPRLYGDEAVGAEVTDRTETEATETEATETGFQHGATEQRRERINILVRMLFFASLCAESSENSIPPLLRVETVPPSSSVSLPSVSVSSARDARSRSGPRGG